MRQRKRRMYIAGPMRGLPLFNRDAFSAAEKVLREGGYDPINPWKMDFLNGVDLTKLDPHTSFSVGERKQFIRRDVRAILSLDPRRKDGIVLLPGWSKSSGATAEFALARWLKLAVYMLDPDWPPAGRELTPYIG